MLIIAHRGASAIPYTSGRVKRGASGRIPPENTLSAFDLAFTQDADGLEFDVRLAACGTPVIIHDATLERTTRGAGKVSDYDALALAALGVPTLAEMLQRYAGSGLLFIEIKAPEAALPSARLVEEAVQSGNWMREQLVVIGFDHACLLAARTAYPNLVLGLSGDAPKEEAAWLPVRHDLITPEMVEKTLSAGISLAAWTVNDPHEAARLHALGVAALMTDRPAEVRGWIAF